MNNLLVFVHLPKTAGTTMTRSLQNQFNPEEIFLIEGADPAKSVNQYFEMPYRKRFGYKLIMGHGAYKLIYEFMDSAKWFTVLRDPVDRILSTYYFILEKPNHFLHDQVKDLGIEAFIQSDVFKTLVNRYAWTFANFMNEELDSKKPEAQEILEKALNHLERDFFLVGLTEKFDMTLKILCYEMGWSDAGSYESVNITKNRPKVADLPNHVIEQIREKNHLDVTIYEAHKVRFEKMSRVVFPNTSQSILQKV